MFDKIGGFLGGAADWLGTAGSKVGEFVLDLPNEFHKIGNELGGEIYTDATGVATNIFGKVQQERAEQAGMVIGGGNLLPIVIIGVVAYLLLKK